MSALIKWNPFGELDEMQNRLGMFFGGYPSFSSKISDGNGKSRTLPNWSPLVDITEDDHEYLFKADLPEVKKEDLKINVENGILSVSGERKTEKEVTKKKYHRLERFFGTFERTFMVPEDADASKIRAEFKDGVLRVHLPKLPTAKPKTIAVQIQ